MNKEIRINPTFEFENTDEDVRFSPVKVWVAHIGWNLNGSYFSKEILGKMAESIAHIPITGFLQQDEYNNIDFAGHEEKIVIEEDGIEYVYLGVPFGFIPKENNYKFEEKEVNGQMKTFLTVEGIVWNKFEAGKALTGTKGHSMELLADDLEGDWVDDFEGESGYVITNATFDALCVLGDDYMPAMTGSIIEKYQKTYSKKESIKDIFKEMFNEYTSYLEEGGEKVSKNKVEDKFELTAKQKTDMLQAALQSQFSEDDWVWIYTHDEEMVYYEVEGQMYIAPYEIVDGDAVINFEEAVEGAVKIVPESELDFTVDVIAPVNEKYSKEIEDIKANHEKEIKEKVEEVESDYKAKLSEASDKYAELKIEKENLAEFKANALRENRKEYVESIDNLDESEKAELVENIDNYTMDTLEDEVAKIIGKKSIKFSANKQGINLEVFNKEDDTNLMNDGLSNFIRKYSKKNEEE